MLELVAVELLELAERVVEHGFGNRRLDVGKLRLHALVADGGELAELVGHPAELTPHPQTACLAGVSAGERFRCFAEAHPTRRVERVEHLLHAAADRRWR